MDKIVKSIREIDLSELKMPMVVVYANPIDYPNKAVARIYDAEEPTNMVVVKDTLYELQRDISWNTRMVFVGRGPEDVKSLVGVWI